MFLPTIFRGLLQNIVVCAIFTVTGDGCVGVGVVSVWVLVSDILFCFCYCTASI